MIAPQLKKPLTVVKFTSQLVNGVLSWLQEFLHSMATYLNTVAAPADIFMSAKNENTLVKATAAMGSPLDVQYVKKCGACRRRARP